MGQTLVVDEHQDTPWGRADGIEQVAPGIRFYSTPSHGGYLLTGPAWTAMPQYFKDASFNGLGKGGWFEEDGDAAMVALVFHEQYPDRFMRIETARQSLAFFHPEELARWDAGER